MQHFPKQSAHRCAHLSKLPIGWHPPHVAPQIEQRASPGQDGFGKHMGPPKGFLFLFVHWFNEGCCVEGREIGEEVRFVVKVTKETHL